jgi:hypothetical protein
MHQHRPDKQCCGLAARIRATRSAGFFGRMPVGAERGEIHERKLRKHEINKTLPQKSNFMTRIPHLKIRLGLAALGLAGAMTCLQAQNTLTNSLVAYWPLASIQGTKTPDMLNGYDFTVYNAPAIVPGPDSIRTNAMYFNGSASAWRDDLAGESLPVTQYANYTIALWVNALSGQSGPAAFSEGNNSDTSSAFILRDSDGTTLTPWLRDPANPTLLYTAAPVFDGNWHYIVYEQTNDPGTGYSGYVYIDGTLDANCTPYLCNGSTCLTGLPLPFGLDGHPAPNRTGVATLIRTGPGLWIVASIVDLAIWNRNLSASEVSQIYTNGMPPVAPNIPPISIASFTADTPTALQGGSETLRWNANRFATALSIDNGIGSVLSKSTAGVGSLTVTNMQKTTTYTLTASRGADQVTAQVTVVVVSGVNPGWIPLDTFDEYTNGPLANAFPYWHASGDPSTIMQMPDSNQVLQVGVGTQDANYDMVPAPFFNLAGNAVTNNQAVTLFFRFYTETVIDETGTPVVSVEHSVGLTDLSPRWYPDTDANVGPSVLISTDSGTFALGAQNGVGAPTDWAVDVVQPDSATLILTNDMIYDVWLDVTNTTISVGPVTYSVWIAPDTNLANLTEVFTNYVSNENPTANVTGGVEVQTKGVVFAGGASSSQVLFDDFYLSPAGYNHTVPRPHGLTTGQGVAGTLNISAVTGNRAQIYWSGGALQSAASLNGPWTPVAGASVPYYTPGTTNTVFYRSAF